MRIIIIIFKILIKLLFYFPFAIFCFSKTFDIDKLDNDIKEIFNEK